uniref:ABC transporter ATP-binding protein (ABC transporter ATP-binding/permease rpotein) ) n=1 Tax=Ganoderma boninense TaxID=34458 RepID=A0A5K1K5B0_9APHY|nr:ABC transporter ATP-binding protein (ABC transporter ATP-binding/permease rpotein) (EC (Inner membrane ABC-transporter YbtP) [Ganoderma boninense]
MVPWKEWGTAGTRIAYLGAGAPLLQFSPMGCSCAVTQRRHDVSRNAHLRVLLFDVHPWAGSGPGAAQRNTNTLNTLLRDTAADEDEGEDMSVLAETSFPFAVSRRDLPLARDDRCPTVVLAEDGLLLLVRASRPGFRG